MGVNGDMLAVVAALAALNDNELHALIAATNGVPQTARACWRGWKPRAIGKCTAVAGTTMSYNRPRLRSRRRRTR